MAIDPKFPGSPPSPITTPVIDEPALDDDGLPQSDVLPDPLGTQDRPDDWKDPSGADDLGFDPESPDLEDPEVDPLHPARTQNDPVNR
ncbi:DUF6021 family protein [Pseudomonas sp. NA-150]|uniref:DUF6021 family protein n=1 Tax=Pseudomonas sp. NA-150 TaxID=3367525 RepID=UPI0037CBCB37